MAKTALTDHAIHNTLAVRWSPYSFSSQPVARADLAALFEAARWAPSSYNEQPWRYIVGMADAAGGDDTHDRILKVLAEPNQAWARHVPVLALGVVTHEFAASGKTNKAAIHDLGLASGNLVVEATTRGLSVHQMIGLDAAAAAQSFDVPDGSEVLTALAIGYADRGPSADPEFLERDSKPRSRNSIGEFVFSGRYGQSASF